jgi:hypothetical protein
MKVVPNAKFVEVTMYVHIVTAETDPISATTEEFK